MHETPINFYPKVACENVTKEVSANVTDDFNKEKNDDDNEDVYD